MARKIKQKNANYIKEQKRQTFEKTLHLESVRPKTENQKKIFSQYFQKKHIFVHGLPGTGKTFISLYLALKDLLSHRSPHLVAMITLSRKDFRALPISSSE